jgi:hypothetical protein
MKKMFLIAALALLIPAMAQAMTVADVIKLSQSGVGDEVIQKQIESSGEVFTLTVDDILELKKAGVSDRVITYMINTGKGDNATPETRDDDGDDNAREYERYHGDLDGYYRGYNDASYNLFLSWGWGGYYYPTWYAYWPGYRYYYPSYWCGSWYYPYPYYYSNHHHGRGHGGHYGHDSRAYKDGRNLGNRGGASNGSYQGPYANTRQSKGGQPAYGGRGGRTAKQPGTSSGTIRGSQGGGRQGKSPTYGGRGGTTNRTAPAPTFSAPRSGAGTSPAPAPSRAPAPSSGSQGGRTMKGS